MPQFFLPLWAYDALDRILKYLWEKEKRDYEANPQQQEGHLFKDMNTIREWAWPGIYKREDLKDGVHELRVEHKPNDPLP